MVTIFPPGLAIMAGLSAGAPSLSESYLECIRSFGSFVLALSEDSCHVIHLERVHLSEILETTGDAPGSRRIWTDTCLTSELNYPSCFPRRDLEELLQWICLNKGCAVSFGSIVEFEHSSILPSIFGSRSKFGSTLIIVYPRSAIRYSRAVKQSPWGRSQQWSTSVSHHGGCSSKSRMNWASRGGERRLWRAILRPWKDVLTRGLSGIKGWKLSMSCPYCVGAISGLSCIF